MLFAKLSFEEVTCGAGLRRRITLLLCHEQRHTHVVASDFHIADSVRPHMHGLTSVDYDSWRPSKHVCRRICDNNPYTDKRRMAYAKCYTQSKYSYHKINFIHLKFIDSWCHRC